MAWTEKAFGAGRSPAETKKCLMRAITMFGRVGLPLIYVLFVVGFMAIGVMQRK